MVIKVLKNEIYWKGPHLKLSKKYHLYIRELQKLGEPWPLMDRRTSFATSGVMY